MLNGKRALIVEDEFLVALDIQRILEHAHVGRAVFARSVEEAMSLAQQWRDFDLAIVELPFADTDALALATGLLGAGVKLIVSSTNANHRTGVPGLENWPVILKPFAEDELLSACQRVLGS